jgi:hypothetical protein
MRPFMAGLSRRAFLAVIAFLATRVQAQAPRVSLDEFMELSQRLLERSKLDPEVGQIYLNALVVEADTAIYLATLVQSNGNPTPEQKVVAATIVEWWYTGVYQVNGTSRVATHIGALIWSAMSMPAPGTCSGAFGAWSRPPDGIA